MVNQNTRKCFGGVAYKFWSLLNHSTKHPFIIDCFKPIVNHRSKRTYIIIIIVGISILCRRRPVQRINYEIQGLSQNCAHIQFTCLLFTDKETEIILSQDEILSLCVYVLKSPSLLSIKIFGFYYVWLISFYLPCYSKSNKCSLFIKCVPKYVRLMKDYFFFELFVKSLHKTYFGVLR